MLSVNEKSPIEMKVVFTNAAGDPLVPTTVDWRIDDLTNGAQVRDWTNLPSPASTMTVVVPGSDNAIDENENVKEVQLFGIRVDTGLDGEGHAELEYNVLNLKGPTGP